MKPLNVYVLCSIVLFLYLCLLWAVTAPLLSVKKAEAHEEQPSLKFRHKHPNPDYPKSIAVGEVLPKEGRS